MIHEHVISGPSRRMIASFAGGAVLYQNGAPIARLRSYQMECVVPARCLGCGRLVDELLKDSGVMLTRPGWERPRLTEWNPCIPPGSA